MGAEVLFLQQVQAPVLDGRTDRHELALEQAFWPPSGQLQQFGSQIIAPSVRPQDRPSKTTMAGVKIGAAANNLE